MSKKHSGHYCRICGRIRANEKFSGGSHKNHICKDCARLPAAKRNELETVNRLMNLPFCLSKKQKKWLRELMNDQRNEVREAAQYAYELRFGGFYKADYEDERFAEAIEYDMPELTTEMPDN